MAKTGGIAPPQRRGYRTIHGDTPLTLPPLAHTHTARQAGYRKGPKTGDIIDAVNKEKWTFLQRLLAIEDKHEQKKQARQKELSSKKKNNNTVPNGSDNSNTTDIRRWMSDQILDDTTEPSFPPEARLSHPDGTKNDDVDGGGKSRYVSSTNDIFSKSHDSAIKDPNSLNDLLFDQSTQSSQEQQPQTHPQPQLHKEPSLLPRAKRKRPLRLPPILLPPLYATRPRPLQEREFLTPTKVRGPVTDAEWDDLHNCRYLRHAPPKYALQISPSQTSFYYSN